jgi:hypothetical protein
MVWQRLLLLLTAVLLLLGKSAQAEEKEPTAIIELGGAGEGGLRVRRVLAHRPLWSSPP